MFRELVFTSFVIFCWTDVLAGPITTSDTSKFASIMKLNLDTSANPCDNFNRFVCGSSNITSLKQKINSDDITATQLVMDLIQKGTGSKDFRPFQLIDDVHKTCMSDEAIGEHVVKSLSPVFEKLGGWPLLQGSQWQSKDDKWMDLILHSKLIGTPASPFLIVEPIVLPENSRAATRFEVDGAAPEFKRSITNASDPLLVAYTTYLEKSCVLIGCQKTYPDEIKDIVDLEWKLSEIRHRAGETVTMNILTFKQLTEKYPSVFWSKLFHSLYPISQEKLDLSNMTICVSRVMANIIDLLDKTDSRVLSNYASWKVLQQAIPYLSKDFQDLKHEYCKTQECKVIPREVSCFNIVLGYLRPAVNLLYAKRYISDEAHSLVSDMVANLKGQTKDLISKSSWMDQDTKKKFIDEVVNMPVIIGYAEKNNTDDDFVKYFEELEVDTSNFFQTLLNLEKFDSRKRFYNTKNFGPRYHLNPVLAYSPVSIGGKLYIPLGLLREPFFSVDYPMSVNYGILGRGIVKELVAGIFYQQDSLSQAVKDRVECFSKQITDVNSSQDKKKEQMFRTAMLIGDHLAIKISYQAYQSWLTSVSGGSEPMIPGLPYSHRQLYWMSFLQYSCVQSPEEVRTIEDKYAPIEFRTMKVLTNAPEFYDDFNCKSKPFLETHGPSCTFL